VLTGLSLLEPVGHCVTDSRAVLCSFPSSSKCGCEVRVLEPGGRQRGAATDFFLGQKWGLWGRAKLIRLNVLFSSPTSITQTGGGSLTPSPSLQSSIREHTSTRPSRRLRGSLAGVSGIGPVSSDCCTPHFTSPLPQDASGRCWIIKPFTGLPQHFRLQPGSFPQAPSVWHMGRTGCSPKSDRGADRLECIV